MRRVMLQSPAMDRGIRIMGGCVIIGLALVSDEIDVGAKITVTVVGLYGIITGILNFCPLYHFILQEKRTTRKKTAADAALNAYDLKTVIFFNGLNDEEIEKVVSLGRIKQYCRDEHAACEGNHKKVLSIILSGQFKTLKTTAQGDATVIDTLSVGETFGEGSFFDSRSLRASIVSAADAKVLEIDDVGFSQLIERDPYLGIKIMTRLMSVTSRRMERLDEQIASMGH